MAWNGGMKQAISDTKFESDSLVSLDVNDFVAMYQPTDHDGTSLRGNGVISPTLPEVRPSTQGSTKKRAKAHKAQAKTNVTLAPLSPTAGALYPRSKSPAVGSSESLAPHFMSYAQDNDHYSLGSGDDLSSVISANSLSQSFATANNGSVHDHGGSVKSLSTSAAAASAAEISPREFLAVCSVSMDAASLSLPTSGRSTAMVNTMHSLGPPSYDDVVTEDSCNYGAFSPTIGNEEGQRTQLLLHHNNTLLSQQPQPADCDGDTFYSFDNLSLSSGGSRAKSRSTRQRKNSSSGGKSCQNVSSSVSSSYFRITSPVVPQLLEEQNDEYSLHTNIDLNNVGLTLQGMTPEQYMQFQLKHQLGADCGGSDFAAAPTHDVCLLSTEDSASVSPMLSQNYESSESATVVGSRFTFGEESQMSGMSVGHGDDDMRSIYSRGPLQLSAQHKVRPKSPSIYGDHSQRPASRGSDHRQAASSGHRSSRPKLRGSSSGGGGSTSAHFSNTAESQNISGGLKLPKIA